MILLLFPFSILHRPKWHILSSYVLLMQPSHWLLNSLFYKTHCSCFFATLSLTTDHPPSPFTCRLSSFSLCLFFFLLTVYSLLFSFFNKSIRFSIHFLYTLSLRVTCLIVFTFPLSSSLSHQQIKSLAISLNYISFVLQIFAIAEVNPTLASY